jgi:hypothetical protein
MEPLTLQELFDLVASAPADADPKDVVKAKVAEAIAAGQDVTDLVQEISDTFDKLGQSDKDVEAGEQLADISDAIQAAQTEVQAAKDARAEKMDALRTRIFPKAEDESADDAEGADAEGKADEAPAAEAEAEPEGDAGAEVVAEAEAATAEAAAEPEPVTAAAKPRPRISLRDLRRPETVAPKDNTADEPEPVAITAAADINGYATGQKLNSIKELGTAANVVLNSMPQGVPNVYVKKGIGNIAVRYPEELVASGANDGDVVAYATDPTRLPGGSLVASGGWCSPSETVYDLAPGLESGSAGLVSISDMQIRRGGIRYTEGPDFSELWTGIGFAQTEAQAIAGDEKTCYRVPCTTFVDERAEVKGVCIEVGTLQDHAYPELTERVVNAAPIVHEHKVNQSTLAKMVALSGTAIPMNVGPSAALNVLNSIALQIVDYRYLYRADESLQLQVVAPMWLKSHFIADLALRQNWPEEDITDAIIEAWFRNRGAVVSWVYDWQDAYSNAGTGFGGANPITGFQTSVDVMIFAAGTFVRGRGDIISLSGIYDSTNLKKNDYLRLFMEESFLVIRRQWHSRLVRIPLDVNGVASLPQKLSQGVIAPATP